MAVPSWESSVKEAKKAMGSDAEIPDLPKSIEKASAAFGAAKDAYMAMKDSYKEKLLDADNANSALKNAVEQFRATVAKSNFGLDPKAEQKKIEQGRKILLAQMDAALKSFGENDKNLAAITRALG